MREAIYTKPVGIRKDGALVYRGILIDDNKHRPHQGKKEREKRMRQLEKEGKNASI